MDWFTVVLVGFAGFAGFLGGSATRDDRLADIGRVFMRRPWRLIGVWVAFSALYGIIEAVRR